jgi:pantothenate kinase-related protein Tda10
MAGLLISRQDCARVKSFGYRPCHSLLPAVLHEHADGLQKQKLHQTKHRPFLVRIAGEQGAGGTAPHRLLRACQYRASDGAMK